MDEAQTFLSKQQSPPRHLAVPSHCSSPLLSDRLGAIRGCSRQNVAVPRRAQRRVHTLIRFGWPALACPVTMMPNSGDATFREAGPICINGATAYGEPCFGTVTRLARVPRKAPSGRPGVRMSRCPPLRPATGRRLPAPARRSRNATAPPAACAPAPRCPASANARRGR